MYGIRNILRWTAVLDSTAIFESSFVDGPRPFTIPAAGAYDIWIKAPRFKLNALTDRQPEVRPANGGPPVRLTGSLFRTNMMRGSFVTMKIATFSAPRGPYLLGLAPAAKMPPGTRESADWWCRLRGNSDVRRLRRRGPRPIPPNAICRCATRWRNSTMWIFKGVLAILLGTTLDHRWHRRGRGGPRPCGHRRCAG